MDKLETINWGNYFGSILNNVVDASERYREIETTFVEKGLAEGNTRTVATPSVTLTELFIQTERPLQLKDDSSIESADSLFVLDGDVESKFSNIKTPLTFTGQAHTMQYNTDFSGTHTIHSRCFHALNITYDLAHLRNLLQSNEGAFSLLGKSLAGRKNFLAAPAALKWQHHIADVIHAIRHCRFQGLTRYIFLENKLMELFVLQLEQYHASQSTTISQKWNNSDREKLMAVRDYIQHSFLEQVTLTELTRKFELNEFKLKKGYKQLFQSTVFGDILQLRMHKAKSLLQEREMNVSEVAFFIGYDNVSSFSVEFKKRFGYSPSRIT